MKALEIKNLKKVYANKVEALKGIDLVVESGDFFALLGPNGAGKSTTIGIISSLVNKDQGSISICGVDIDENFPLAKTKLGVVNQEFNFSQFEKVRDVIMAQAGYYGVSPKIASARTEEYLKKLGIWDKRDVFIRELRRGLWDFLIDINKGGTTIILTTHYLEEAENLCRNIAIIDNGAIIENTKMEHLLKKLENQVFTIETTKSIPENLRIDGFSLTIEDNNKFSVIVPKDVSMNTLFENDSFKQLEVTNIKNQTNRLEELFLNLTSKK